MAEGKLENHKYMEITQQATEHEVQWINQRRNKKIPWNKWKYDNLKSMECSKSRSKKEIHSDKPIKKQERFQIT